MVPLLPMSGSKWRWGLIVSAVAVWHCGTTRSPIMGPLEGVDLGGPSTGSPQSVSAPSPASASSSLSSAAHVRSDGRTSSSRDVLRRWAAGFRTPNHCESQARLTVAKSPVTAFQRIQACSLRPDFDVLAPLLRDPWLPLIKNAGIQGIDVLVRTISRRNELVADIGSCQAAGFEITAVTSEDALADVGSGYVVAVGRVRSVAEQVELVQLSYDVPGVVSPYRRRTYRRTTPYRSRRVPYRRPVRRYRRSYRSPNVRARDIQAWYETDRRLRFSPSRACPVRAGDTRFILGRITKTEIPESPALGREVGWMSIVNCYPVELEVRAKGP